MDIDAFLTDEDKASAAYYMCVGAWGAAGMAVGAASGGTLAIVVGFGAGALWAKTTCGTLEDWVKRRLSAGKTAMTEQDFALLKYGVKKADPSLSDPQVMKLIENAAREMVA